MPWWAPECRAARPVTAKYGQESQYFDLDVGFYPTISPCQGGLPQLLAASRGEAQPTIFEAERILLMMLVLG